MTRERPLLLCSLIVFLFMFVGLAPTAMAAPLPVSPSDPGRDDGTAAGPVTLAAGAPLASPTAADIKNLDTGLEYATIADALANAATLDGHVLDVQVSPHAEGIVNITKSVTILGGGGGGAVINAAANTGGSGDARAWFLVSAPNVAFENVTLDGGGYSIYQAIRNMYGLGLVVDQCTFQNIQYLPYQGTAVATAWDAVVTDCSFTGIGRVGVLLYGPNVTAGLVSGCTYAGKGPGDWLDYGIELGGGAVATVTNNTITGCTAIESGWSSAGVLITYSSIGTLTGNVVTGNSIGVAVGYNVDDVATAVVHSNDLTGNLDYALVNTSTTVTVDASANWWGINTPAGVFGLIDGTVDFTPWFHNAGDVNLAPGFQGDYSVLDVDDDSPQVGAVGRIQEGIGLVSGSTINVAAGTYEEQVEVTQDVTIQGVGTATVIKSPVTLALGFATSKPVVYVHDTATMALKDLTVDGAGRGNTNYKFIGVAFRNAGGAVENCTVTGVRDTPFSGAQHGVGIYAYNDDGTARVVTVQGCTVVDFQKNAMALNASDTTPMTLDVTGNIVIGAGPTAVTAQNGIQTWGDLITGTIDYNDVSGIAYSGTGWVATSILVYYADVMVDNNTVTGGHTCIYSFDGDCDITNNKLSVIKAGDYGYGIIATDPPAAKPSPFGEESVEASRTGVLGLAGATALLVIDISGNTVVFGGPDNVNTVGIEADAGYGPDDLAVTANNNTVTGFDYGMGFWQCTSDCDSGVFTSIVANQNDLAGNTGFGFSTNAAVTADATCNWWGSASGPDAPPVYSNPAGVALEGDATFAPWLVSPTGPCAGANEVVADASALGCIHLTDPCVTVPVMFNRVDTTPLRAVSVTFQLSSDLVLCDLGIQPGALLANPPWGSFGPVFQVLDNGSGSYTVDYSILGELCGPTTGGELFTISVAASGAAAPEDVGTITIVSVDARDCGNPFASIPAMPGDPAEITIDNAAPTAIASLTAAQLKSGNDADGTTVITLTWPAVEAGAAVELFRKGFGAYPEYDDAGGTVPTAPADPVAAGWTSLGVQVSPYADEINTERDFYYYVAFVTDACGNVSAVSNQTGGTLNYHLGDVMPSATPPPYGDNQVEFADVSFLGSHYGVADGNPLYENILDIGPTTDNSTNGRPSTDNKIQFEDLIILAINYGTVSKPMPASEGADRNAVALAVAPSTDGIEAVMTLSSTGAVQGVSLPLLWNAEAVEPIAYRSGEMVNRQSGRALVLSPEAGTVDAAVFGSTFAGSGELAVVTFRVIGSGDPGIRFGEVIARDVENRPVALETTVESRDLPVTPVVTRLLPSAPNPFLGSMQIRFALAEPGEAAVRVYALDGRLVRTLVDAALPAGERSVSWDGRDEVGRNVAAGTYIVRFQAAGTTDSQRVMRLR